MLSSADKKRLLNFQKAQIQYDLLFGMDPTPETWPIFKERFAALERLKSITDLEVARLVKVATQKSCIDELSLEEMKARFEEIQQALQELVKISIRLKDIRPDFLRRPN